jgi:hypothetical protein
MIDTATPRFTARTSASVKTPSGTKYGFVIRIDDREESTASRKSM